MADAQVRIDILHHPPGDTGPVALELWDELLRLDARHTIRLHAEGGHPRPRDCGESATNARYHK
jgi:hypothetical protein